MAADEGQQQPAAARGPVAQSPVAPGQATPASVPMAYPLAPLSPAEAVRQRILARLTHPGRNIQPVPVPVPVQAQAQPLPQAQGQQGEASAPAAQKLKAPPGINAERSEPEEAQEFRPVLPVLGVPTVDYPALPAGTRERSVWI